MQRETRIALQRADHAERWTPIIDAFRKGRAPKEKRPMVNRHLDGYSETRLIVDQSGRLIRRGDKMPEPEVTTEVTAKVDLRIPTYIRRGIGGEK